jgi:hypothetical protein
MTLRFPEHPTPDESATLRDFFALFARLYPCAECAQHFHSLITDTPPQTKSRLSASLWLCTIHNQVNKSLGKPEFPCDKLDETYDCGCGDPAANSTASTVPAPPSPSASPALPLTDITPFH